METNPRDDLLLLVAQVDLQEQQLIGVRMRTASTTLATRSSSLAKSSYVTGSAIDRSSLGFRRVPAQPNGKVLAVGAGRTSVPV